MLLTSCCKRFIIRSQASRTWRIRLVVQDAALSRRRSRVRLPYALPVVPFERPRPGYKRLGTFLYFLTFAFCSNNVATGFTFLNLLMRQSPDCSGYTGTLFHKPEQELERQKCWILTQPSRYCSARKSLTK